MKEWLKINCLGILKLWVIGKTGRVLWIFFLFGFSKKAFKKIFQWWRLRGGGSHESTSFWRRSEVTDPKELVEKSLSHGRRCLAGHDLGTALQTWDVIPVWNNIFLSFNDVLWLLFASSRNETTTTPANIIICQKTLGGRKLVSCCMLGKGLQQ